MLILNLKYVKYFRNNKVSSQQQQYSVNGTLKLVNTIEEFKTFDIDSALKSESSIVRPDEIGWSSMEL